MAGKHTLSLFIFRRNLRIEDNRGLAEALRCSDRIIPAFIFDPRQLESNSYKNVNALRFMLESLTELRRSIKGMDGELFFFYGIPDRVVEDLIEKQKVDAVFVNRDYTPFSKKRDEAIETVCKKRGAAFYSRPAALLVEPEDITSGSGKPYTIFTFFFKKAAKVPVLAPEPFKRGQFFRGKILSMVSPLILKKLRPQKNPMVLLEGGRKEAKKLLCSLRNLSNYSKERDFPFLNRTTLLSAHLKFGTLSIREVFSEIINQLGKDHDLIRQLYWRDFFTHIAFHFPEVFGAPFRTKYTGLRWNDNPKYFERWCCGETGFPIVDAGMRELNATGYMHNRVRMITASFLTKDLHINWLRGEKYFAQNLIDYDPAVNNGNWQWCASTGCDAQPYFRIFNPWRQQKRFDPDCHYIKYWIPQLRKHPSRIIHNLHKYRVDTGYPPPLVDHKREAAVSKQIFKSL